MECWFFLGYAEFLVEMYPDNDVAVLEPPISTN